MNINEKMPTIFLGEYGVNVNKYLTYGQIQQIVNNTEQLLSTVNEENKVNNTWGVRQENIDMLVLLLATDIGAEDISKTSHVKFLQSGLIDAVKNNIENYSQIESAFKYTESWDKILISCVQQLGRILQDKKITSKIVEAINANRLDEHE